MNIEYTFKVKVKLRASPIQTEHQNKLLYEEFVKIIKKLNLHCGSHANIITDEVELIKMEKI